MPNLVNRLVLEDLRREFKDVEGMLVVSFGGLTVKESEGLRGQLAEKGVKFSMVRNSLAQVALKERGLEMPASAFSGNTGIAYGKAEAAIHAAKLLTAPDVKKAGKVKIKLGLLEGKLLGDKDAEALASVPDRPTLRAKILGCLSGPQRGLVVVLNAGPAGTARVLKARADQLEKAVGETPAA
ncbi:MAG: 50S ribosomal protein L10 [Planctomycetes bacterium]|nr:50S ribosomal protein L10 [Planctomycetota bacterium]